LGAIIVASSSSLVYNNNDSIDDNTNTADTKNNNVNISNIRSLLLPPPFTTILKPQTTLCDAAPTATRTAAGDDDDEIDDDDDDDDAEAAEAALKNPKNNEQQQRRKQRQRFLRNQATATKTATNRRRMTNVGRFSLVSETAENPSVPVLVLAMTGKPYRSSDFRRLYRERKVAEKHPRFRARLDKDMTHFVFDDCNTTSNSSNDEKQNSDPKKETTTTTTTTGGGTIGSGNYDDNYTYYDRKDNVRDVLFPAIPVAELKCRINDASLYEPLDLTTRLWEAWTATGGAIGQSGAIATPTANEIISSSNNSDDNSDETSNVESLLLFRAHHCMADGVSLAALFGDLMDEGPEMQAEIQRQIRAYKNTKRSTPWWKKLLFFLYYWVWGSLKALAYQAYLFAASWYDQFTHDDPWMLLKAIYDERRRTGSRSSTDDATATADPNANANANTPSPRSLSWMTVATVDEVKKVTQFYSNVHKKQTGNKKSNKITINDVFCSCVSAAIVKQLQYHRAINPQLLHDAHVPPLASSNGQQQQQQKQLSLPLINLIIPVHLQGGILLPGQSMGNKIGAMVSRIPGESLAKTFQKNKNNNMANTSIEHNDPAALAQERLIQVHSVLNERKQTPVAVLSYLMAGVMGYLSSSSSSSSSADNNSSTSSSVGSSSSSWTPWLFRKAHANASVVVTNVRGPESIVHMEGRPVHVFFGFLPLPAGVPVGLTVTSYDKRINLTVTAEEWAVPDAERFLGWVRDEYELLKQRADDEAAAGSS